MSQNPSNSSSDVISEILQQLVLFHIRATSSKSEATVTPEIHLQPTISCHGECEDTSDLKEERDTVIWIARNALDMVPDNRADVTIYRAILDSICPQSQDVCQGEDKQDDEQDNRSDAARARSDAKTKEVSLLRQELGLAWQAYSMMVKLLEKVMDGIQTREGEMNVHVIWLENKIAELAAELKEKSRKLAVHENYNNSSRIATAFAQERRDFHANEKAKKQAAASDDTECSNTHDTSDSHAKTHDTVGCTKCSADKACDVCSMGANLPPTPADFGLDMEVFESDGQKDDTVGRRSPGHQPGVPGVSHKHTPDPALAVEHKQELCGVCGRADVDHKTAYKMVFEVVSGVITGDSLDVTSRVLQAIEDAKQEMGAGMDPTQVSALTERIAEKVLKGISESTVCYTEKTTYADCHICNVRTYPEGMHTIPGSSFGPNIRRILIDFHRMTPAVRPIGYGSRAIVGVIASTGAISNCLQAIAEYAEHGRIRKIPPLPDSDTPQIPLTGSAPITRCDDIPDISDNCTRAKLDTPPIMTQIIDVITMAPYVEFDESASRVKKKRWEALVILTIFAVLIKIKPSRSKDTIQTEFGGMLQRPAVADMYRAGNALQLSFQTCVIHLGRKIEALAIISKDSSWEYVLWTMAMDVFRYVAKINKTITALAGGPDRTACEIGATHRKRPALQDLARAAERWVWSKLAAIAEAYEKVDVTREESRKMAGSIRNAAPYTCTSMYHPGMSWHTNDVERVIRQHHVRARNTYRALPNEQAAKTLGTLQTLHANAHMLGITSGEIIFCRNGPLDLYNTGIPPPIFAGGTGVHQNNATS